MKPDLSMKFDTRWLGIPPGMPAGDLEIWQRYRLMILDFYDYVYYNVRVGEPLEVGDDLPPEIAAMAEAISRRRIDVVLETASAWTLIELKYDAGAEALGQILMYKALWQSDPPDNRPVKPAIVSNRANKDLALACSVYGVEFTVV